MDPANEVSTVEADVIYPTTRGDIERLQLAMTPIKCEMPEAVHHFAPGMYCREFSMPAGMLVVGKIHRFSHFMFVLKGRAIVYTELGEDIVEPGYVTISQPGAKRVVLALEDTTFITIHANRDDVQDLELIEAEHIIPESEEYMDAEKAILAMIATRGVLR